MNPSSGRAARPASLRRRGPGRPAACRDGQGWRARAGPPCAAPSHGHKARWPAGRAAACKTRAPQPSGRRLSRDPRWLWRRRPRTGPARARRAPSRVLQDVSINRRLGAQPACRVDPGGALARFARSPDNVRRYRPPGALARGHARLPVAARGDVLARSRALQVSQVVSRARAHARASFEFRAASSSGRALDVTHYVNLPPGDRWWRWRGPATDSRCAEATASGG